MADLGLKSGVYKNEKRLFESTSHIIDGDKPWCGAAQIVGTDLVILSHGVNLDYVQCKRCIRKYKKIQKGGEL